MSVYVVQNLVYIYQLFNYPFCFSDGIFHNSLHVYDNNYSLRPSIDDLVDNIHYRFNKLLPYFSTNSQR